MEDKKPPNKILIEKQIYWHRKNRPIIWKDIKDLKLEDDDVIYSSWEENESEGYWNGEIIRKVEETDEQYAKRQADNERDAKWAKERRYESYLRLKKEFEDGKQ